MVAQHSHSLLVVCLLALVLHASAVYLELAGGVTKCFLEEVPRDTLIMSKFKLEDMNQQQYGAPQVVLGVHIKITDPNNEVILEKIYPADAKFALTAQSGGEHTICYSTNSSRWFGPAVRTVSLLNLFVNVHLLYVDLIVDQRLHLDIETGVGAVDYEELAKVEHLDGISLLSLLSPPLFPHPSSPLHSSLLSSTI